MFNIANKLANKVDITLSGHTHQGYNCVRNGICVMQAFAFGRGVSQLDLEISWNVNIDASKTRVVNVTVVSDNNTATAVLTVTETAAKSSSTIALINAGSVRAVFTCATPPCLVAFSQAFTVQPFGNSVVAMSLTDQQIKDVLQQQWIGANAATPRILQPSRGFTSTWNNAVPAGNRATHKRLNGTPINLTTNYRVTVKSFLADGGNVVTTLLAGPNRLGCAQDIVLTNFFAAN